MHIYIYIYVVTKYICICMYMCIYIIGRYIYIYMHTTHTQAEAHLCMRRFGVVGKSLGLRSHPTQRAAEVLARRLRHLHLLHAPRTQMPGISLQTGSMGLLSARRFCIEIILRPQVKSQYGINVLRAVQKVICWVFCLAGMEP